ncbi:hypothetical protein MPSEU_000720500 [Mayamaea pseudoterrestris]|nr:hypothetical protein MPSEU_000720500 [Mayamaea pseudoterrestris]
MNFCGADYEQQVQDTKPAHASFQCGPCVKDEGPHLGLVFSEEGLDTVLSEEAPLMTELRKYPLDVIEERLAYDAERSEQRDDVCQGRDLSVMPNHERPKYQSSISNVSSTTASTTGTAASRKLRMKGGKGQHQHLAPSPVTLIPLCNGIGADRALQDVSCDSQVRYHAHDEIKRSASGSIEGLLMRLKDGFRVKLYGYSGTISEEVLLYLDSGRNRLCLRGYEEENKMEDVINFWQELPIARILRLEIDRKSRRPRNQLQSFSLVLDSGLEKGHTYYDFEAASPIEREIIVATLMIVLEQAHADIGRSRTEEEIESYEVTDDVDVGTRDQPIVCSPSLEEHLAKEGQFSPRRTTRLHNGQFGDTEASLIIDLVDLDDSTVLTPRLDELRRRTLSQTDLNGCPTLPGNADDILSECKGSKQIASAWCADDICTLALKDIADSCAGIFVLKQAEANICTVSGITEEQRLLIEEYIASALGAPSAVLSYLSEADVWNSQGTEGGATEYSSNTSQSRIRNRASVLNAQCDRLRNLRQEMTFAAALKASKERVSLQTTQSFDDARMLKSKSLEKKVADQFHSSALLKHVVGKMMISAQAEPEDEEDVAFYDSDPEDTRPKSRKDPRQVIVDRRRRTDTALPVRALSGPGFEKVKGSNRRVSRKLDEDTIVQIVQQMTNERLTLIGHPTQRSNEPSRSPACVKMWIESGVCLIDGTFILPKLSWMKYESQSATKRRTEQTDPQKLDLLDICRIHTADTIDRQRHPFAVARRSFLIETQSDTLVFEAQTPDECERIVFGMKLVIARLASLLMLRDGRAAEEFFGAISANVPGEAPEWTKSEMKGGRSSPPSETDTHMHG